MKAVILFVAAFALSGCFVSAPATTKAACDIFDDPGFAVRGKRLKDSQWIGKTQETGIAVCGWKRPLK